MLLSWFVFKVLPLMKMVTAFLSKNPAGEAENGRTFTASSILKLRLFRRLRTRFHNIEEEDLDRRAPKWQFFLLCLSWTLGKWLPNTKIEQKHNSIDIFFPDLRTCIILILPGWRGNPPFFSLGWLKRKRHVKELKRYVYQSWFVVGWTWR